MAPLSFINEFSDIKRLSSYIDDVSRIKNADDFKTFQSLDDFKSFDKKFAKFPEIKLEFNKKLGKAEFKIRDKTIDIQKLNKDMGNLPDPVKGTFKAKTSEVYRQFDPKIDLNAPSSKKFFKDSDVALDNRPGIKDINEIKDAVPNDTTPTNPNTAKKIIAETDNPKIKELEGRIKDLEKNVTPKTSYIETSGKWLKRAALIGVTGLVVSNLVEAVNNYRSAMNGCWLINTKTGEKYKIRPLSCDPTSRDVKESTLYDFKFVSYCNNKDSCNGFVFNPMLIDNSETPPVPPYPNLDIPGNYDENTGKCYNYPNCVKPCLSLDANNSENCYKCSCENFNCQEGFVLYCANFTFAQAFFDFTGKELDNLGTDVSFIITWLKYISIGILVIVGLVVLARIFMFVKSLFGGSSESSSDSSTTSTDGKEVVIRINK
jgi:hypothetical protein